MAERSIRASSEGIQKAKKVVKDQGWTQTEIGEEVGKSRQPVGKFLAGKPIERPIFIDICRLLDLDWEEIAEPEPEQQNQDTSIDIDALVQEVREKIKPIIQERCGTMRVLDMTQPIGLNDIYTNVNILEKITGRRRKEIPELLQECNFDDVERFGLGKISEKRVPGLKAVEKYPKLMILGKPGAGKTTFLKHLAIQCNQDKFQADHVPIFVTLRDFAEDANKPSLLEYINQQFAGCGVIETRVIPSLQDVIERGRALILLDGLDEVREEDNKRVLKEMREFSDQFRDNHFVMTCRIAAREYTFEKFTEVEVADFDSKQISTFASNWFKNKAVKAETFIERLEENERINELAASPLLLTLLCLAFEESGDFPANRSELYKEGLDALLKKWDAKRGIQRDQVYKKLSIQRKEDLLSKIALTTFEQGDYFFKQKIAEQYITDYIRNLRDANTDEEVLHLDSQVVLGSIEYQHGLLVERAKGIYSFSHLTFHEYFTAREIVFGTQPLQERLQNLVSHIIEKRWREVFLLAVGMSPSADRLLLLMKEQVDTIVAADDNLQKFLIWVNQKSFSVAAPYKLSAVRAFYFCFPDMAFKFAPGLGIVLNKMISLGLSNKIDHNLANFGDLIVELPGFEVDLFPELAIDFGLLTNLDHALDLKLSNLISFQNILCFNLKVTLKRELKKLQLQLPIENCDNNILMQWWDVNRKAWIEQLRAVMIEHRNVGHDWQFSKQQKELLKQYYKANLLLVQCLNSDCYVSREVRQEIEDTLLLPIAEIEQRKRESM